MYFTFTKSGYIKKGQSVTHYASIHRHRSIVSDDVKIPIGNNVTVHHGGGRAWDSEFPIDFQFKSVNISTILTSKLKLTNLKLDYWLSLGIYISLVESNVNKQIRLNLRALIPPCTCAL